MSLKRGLLYFIGLTVGVGALALYYTSDNETWHILSRARCSGIAVAFIVSAVGWISDALRIQVIADIMEEHIEFKTSLQLVFLNSFGSAITPFQGGGGPLLIYVLHGKGIPIGKGVALTLVRTIFTVLMLGLFVPLSFLFVPEVLKESAAMTGIFLYAIIFGLLFGGLIVISITKSESVKRIAKIVTLWMDRLKLFRMSVLSTVRFLNKQIDLYKQNMKLLFRGGVLKFLLVVFLTALYLVSLIGTLPALAWALGMHVSIEKTILVQGLFLFVLYFVPTPGASGIAEGGGVAVYKVLFPLNMTGVLSIGWRFLVHYLPTLIGAVMAVEMIGLEIMSKIMRGKDDELN